jgi:hypothetical protein
MEIETLAVCLCNEQNIHEKNKTNFKGIYSEIIKEKNRVKNMKENKRQARWDFVDF